MSDAQGFDVLAYWYTFSVRSLVPARLFSAQQGAEARFTQCWLMQLTFKVACEVLLPSSPCSESVPPNED